MISPQNVYSCAVESRFSNPQGKRKPVLEISWLEGPSEIGSRNREARRSLGNRFEKSGGLGNPRKSVREIGRLREPSEIGSRNRDFTVLPLPCFKKPNMLNVVLCFFFQLWSRSHWCILPAPHNVPPDKTRKYRVHLSDGSLVQSPATTLHI